MAISPVIIKSNKYGIVVRLNADMEFSSLLEEVGRKFAASANFFQDAKMALTFQGRELTKDQEDQLVDAIISNSRIQVLCIVDERPEEEEYYLQAVRQAEIQDPNANGKFYRGSLQAGETLEADTSIVLLGDVAPGASVTSKGNVVVLGSCRGNIYAGSAGNRSCYVAALVMKPLQVRIADKMARSAIAKRTDNTEYALEPKIAYIKDDHIHVKNMVRSTLEEILNF